MFADYSLGKKMILLLCIFILLDIFGNVAGLVCGLSEDVLLSKTDTIRLEQLVASIIVFIGTPYLFFYLSAKPECTFSEFFKLGKSNGILLYILAITAWILLIPTVNYTAYYNEQFTLPESLHFIEEKLKYMENLAKELTTDLLKTDSPLILTVNLLVIAAIPAIGEEMTFRGALQKTLQEHLSPVAAIIITSAIFSAMHFQFYGFIPRFLLSIFLGMLYYFSGSIKLNMLAHFCNNAIAVIAFYICTVAKVSIDDAPTETMGKDDIYSVIISIVLFAGIMHVIYTQSKKKINE